MIEGLSHITLIVKDLEGLSNLLTCIFGNGKIISARHIQGV